MAVAVLNTVETLLGVQSSGTCVVPGGLDNNLNLLGAHALPRLAQAWLRLASGPSGVFAVAL